jgi:IS605 OrfB family transposase
MQKVYFSNRIYKRDLDKEVVLSIDKLIANYTHCLHTAYNFKVQCERDPSLVVESDYKYLKDKLSSPNVYILNSAINEAKGLIKSQNELRKLHIKNQKTKIQKIKNKIAKVSKSKQYYQDIKDCLKCNKPIKKGLIQQKGDLIVVTHRHKNQTIRDEYSLYDFETQYLKAKQKQLRQRLGVLKFKLNKEQSKLDKLNDNTYIPAIVFGGKSICRQSLNDKNKKKLWLQKRSNQIIVSGRKDSVDGNFVFKYDPNTKEFAFVINKIKTAIKNVVFPYGGDKVAAYYQSQPMNRDKPITYAIEDKGKYYIIKCILTEEAPATIYYALDDGVIGVDSNYGFYAATNINFQGQLLENKSFDFVQDGTSSNQLKTNVEKAAKELVQYAVSCGKPIAIENLQIATNIKGYNENTKRNRKLSQFAKTKMIEAILSRAAKDGVDVYFVNPTYTSFIGKIKHMPYYKKNIHTMAAYVIGRRALGLKERLPHKYKAESWPKLYKKLR